MATSAEGSAAEVRAAARALCGSLMIAEAIDRPRLVDAWVSGLSSGAGDALAVTLLDACRLVAATLHDGRSSSRCRCETVSWSIIASFTSESRSDLRDAFRTWAHELLAHVAQDHPCQPVDCAAALVRATPGRAWRVRPLAALAGTTPVRLRDAFQQRFGVAPLAYVHLVRVARAVVLCATSMKVESMAREVGYRSKKDLYAAMDRWVGVTPARLRGWSADERRALELRLRLLAHRGVIPRKA